MSNEIEIEQEASVLRRSPMLLAKIFIHTGVLPWIMLIAIIIFAFSSDSFLTVRNLNTVLRQSTYLVMASIGQMIVLITAGLDLSIGVVFSITSVICSMVMVAYLAGHPEAAWTAIFIGSMVGMCAGTSVGIVNGVGVSLFRVPPFIMTLAMASIVFGIALTITGGVPVYGMPEQFSTIIGYGHLWGMPVPVWITGVFVIVSYLILYRTKVGRYIYAIGGSVRAATLSGINTRAYLLLAYVFSAFMASVAAVLLTARLESGEANIGVAFPLQTIAACAIGGVSLFGGSGRLPNVVLGAIFIILVQNGMNLMRVGSYLQMVAIGILLILAVIADHYRTYLQSKLSS